LNLIFDFVFCFGRRGFNIIMTTSLSSDIPVGYFSWAEYDIMAPVRPKTEKALAAAFISNCNGNNFRLKALEMLEKAGIKIDSYGSCHNNCGGHGNFHTCYILILFSVWFFILHISNF
jgi:Glycosyltransferase family 10 (fucosyltransferase) C-term